MLIRVNRLSSIEHDRDSALVVLELCVDKLQEAGSVRKPGERVEVGRRLQCRLGSAALDCKRRERSDRDHAADLSSVRPVRLGAVDREGSQHLAAGLPQRMGPDRPQVEALADLGELRRQWIALDILDDHQIAAGSRGTASGHALTNRESVDQLGVVTVDRRAGAVSQDARGSIQQ